MKIAFVYDLVYPFSKGGVEKRIWDLSRLLSSRGHDVLIVGTKFWDGDRDLTLDGVRYRGVCAPSEIHVGGGRRSIWQAARFAFSAGRFLARSRFDVIDVQGMAPLASLVTLAVSRFTRNNVVVTWYEVWRAYWREYLGLLGFGGRLVEWLVARWAPVHASVSRLTTARLRSWGVKNVHWMPIGIDFERIESVAPSRDMACEVLYVGRLAGHKNLELLIDALTVLKLEGIKPSTLIAGEGPERERLEERAIAAGLDNVRFLGRIEGDEEVVSMMKAAQIFAFPSVREGFGLAALEAMASGLPVVAVAHQDNATTELIENGVSGVLTSGDPSDYALGLRELLLEKGLRDSMGSRAKTTAETFDWARLADDVERFYQELSGTLQEVDSEGYRRQNAAR